MAPDVDSDARNVLSDSPWARCAFQAVVSGNASMEVIARDEECNRKQIVHRIDVTSAGDKKLIITYDSESSLVQPIIQYSLPRVSLWRISSTLNSIETPAAGRFWYYSFNIIRNTCEVIRKIPFCFILFMVVGWTRALMYGIAALICLSITIKLLWFQKFMKHLYPCAQIHRRTPISYKRKRG